MVAAASFSYKIGGGGLIFIQNWRRWQGFHGFGNITGGVLTWSGYWVTRKIRVAQKNVIEEKLLENKRSIRRGMYLFQIRTGVLIP